MHRTIWCLRLPGFRELQPVKAEVGDRIECKLFTLDLELAPELSMNCTAWMEQEGDRDTVCERCDAGVPNERS